MANYIGGDSLEVTYNHPTLSTGTFDTKAAETATYDLGGIRNNDDASGITGGGQVIRTKNRVRPFFEVVIAVDFTAIGDTLEKLNDLAASPVDATWTISNINGGVYQLVGNIVGDIQLDTNASTLTIKVDGSNRMLKIA